LNDRKRSVIFKLQPVRVSLSNRKQLLIQSLTDTIRYGRFTCAQKLTGWPA